MRFNKEYAKERLAWIAEILNVRDGEMDEDTAADRAADAIETLTKELGLPSRLRDVGVTVEDFRDLADDAIQDLIVATNPRPVTSADVVIELLHSAY